MRLQQRFDQQTREYSLVFEPGELADQSSAFSGVPFQPHHGEVIFFRHNGGPWQFNMAKVMGPRRKKDRSLGTQQCDTRFVSLDYLPEPLRQTVEAQLKDLNS